MTVGSFFRPKLSVRIKIILMGNTFLCVGMWGQNVIDFKKYLLKMDLNFRLII